MAGRDPLTEGLIAFVCFKNAALFLSCYLMVLLAYLVDELGLLTFRSKWLEALYSRASLTLFVVGSPVFMLVTMVFAFVWGFSS
jgi:hypothetical protein